MIYPEVLKIRKCQRWFFKFRSRDFDLSDASRSVRPVALDITTFYGQLLKADPCQNVK